MLIFGYVNVVNVFVFVGEFCPDSLTTRSWVYVFVWSFMYIQYICWHYVTANTSWFVIKCFDQVSEHLTYIIVPVTYLPTGVRREAVFTSMIKYCTFFHDINKLTKTHTHIYTLYKFIFFTNKLLHQWRWSREKAPDPQTFNCLNSIVELFDLSGVKQFPSVSSSFTMPLLVSLGKVVDQSRLAIVRVVIKVNMSL